MIWIRYLTMKPFFFFIWEWNDALWLACKRYKNMRIWRSRRSPVFKLVYKVYKKISLFSYPGGQNCREKLLWYKNNPFTDKTKTIKAYLVTFFFLFLVKRIIQSHLRGRFSSLLDYMPKFLNLKWCMRSGDSLLMDFTIAADCNALKEHSISHLERRKSKILL